MNSSASAGRSLRNTRRTPVTPASVIPKGSKLPDATTTSAMDSTETTDLSMTVQELRDELEELTDVKASLENKVTQLEERAQYLEANARLNASMLSKEIMDLTEKGRKLEIELSTVIDERDILEQEKEQLTKQVEVTQDKDEAKQLSTNLKDTWIRLSALMVDQKEYVQKLFESEEANVKLKAELTKAVDLSDTTKNAHAEEKKQWVAEKHEYMAEIESLKEKFTQSSKEGGKQIIDWEEDKTRLRNSFKQERSVWDKEKKGFLDQIASLKVKVSVLSVKKTPPPEWILEKHQLVGKCMNLQSRITSLESDRVNNGGGPEGHNLKKLEVEKQKMEKRMETPKAKLVKVLHSAATLQDNATKKSSQGQRPRSTARKKGRSTAVDSDSDSEDAAMDVQERDEGVRDTVPISARPPRATRAKRTASVKRVNYRVSSEDSEESEEVSNSDDQESATDDGDEGHEREQLDNKDGDMAVEMEMEMEMEMDPEEDSSHSVSTARSKRSTIGKTRKPAEDDNSDSDSEFEPPAKSVLKVKTRGKSNDKKAASPTVEPAPKKSKGSSQSKRQSDETATVGHPGESRPAVASTESSVAASIAASSTTESTPTSTTDRTTDTSTGNTKVKKKRKLLTGKGLEELGDILNGPGSSLSSGPSTGLVFSKGNMRPRTNNHSGTGSGESSLMNGAGPATVKLDALNAIKMAFSLPKPRNSSPS